MKLFKTIFFISLLLIPALLTAQAITLNTLCITPVYNDCVVQTNGTFYRTTASDSVSFETIRFYISGIELLENGKSVWKEENSFHLIDISDQKSLCIRLNTSPGFSFDKIKYNLGIDSLTNVSGALGGDLDPTKGMYWTWQNGYINLKIEGKSNRCNTRNKEFQFHLGGYQFPDNSLQTVTLPCKSQENIIISFDLGKFLGQVDLSKENQIMSPGNDAVLLSKKAASAFSVMK